MGELARRRDARDLAITRTHLLAAGAIVVLLVGLAFTAGVAVGRSGAPAASAAHRGAEPELVDLLARVEASKAGGGLSELTFPTALAGEGGTPPEVAPVNADGEEIAPVPAGEVTLPVYEAPAGAYTIRVATFAEEERDAVQEAEVTLRQMNLPVWIGAERVDGRGLTFVQVGGYATEAEASEALAAMVEGLGASGLGADARVVAR